MRTACTSVAAYAFMFNGKPVTVHLVRYTERTGRETSSSKYTVRERFKTAPYERDKFDLTLEDGAWMDEDYTNLGSNTFEAIRTAYHLHTADKP